MTERYRRDNRANWDDRVAIHRASEEYDWDGFIADPMSISPVVEFDATVVGDVRGKRLLHLQCHFGRDTLSWARLGAEVTGLDFSVSAIEAARQLSSESCTPGRFVVADVYAASELLDDEFDIVYTGVGAINWLPDIALWAEVVTELIAPGGFLYIRDGHPVVWSLELRNDDDALVLHYPYFETVKPVSEEWDHTYAGEGVVTHPLSHEWNHSLSETFTALMSAGLEVVHFAEYRECEWQAPHHGEGRGKWSLGAAGSAAGSGAADVLDARHQAALTQLASGH